MQHEFTKEKSNILSESLKKTHPKDFLVGEILPYVKLVRLENDICTSATDFQWMCPVESSDEENGHEEIKNLPRNAKDIRKQDNVGILNSRSSLQTYAKSTVILKNKTDNLNDGQQQVKTHKGRPASYPRKARKSPAGQKLRREALFRLISTSKLQEKRKTSNAGKMSVEDKSTLGSSPLSAAQNSVMQTYMECHRKDMYGPKWKGPKKRDAMWLDLAAQINALDGYRRSVKEVRSMWSQYYHNVRRNGLKKKTGLCTSTLGPLEKDLLQPTSSEEQDKIGNMTECPPPVHKKRKRSMLREEIGSVLDCTSVPSTTSEKELSPLQATALHQCTSMESAENIKCTEQQGDVLLEVLNYCKVMHTAIQRLEQKVDRLESSLFNGESSHLSHESPNKEPVLVKRALFRRPYPALVSAPLAQCVDLPPLAPASAENNRRTGAALTGCFKGQCGTVLAGASTPRATGMKRALKASKKDQLPSKGLPVDTAKLRPPSAVSTKEEKTKHLVGKGRLVLIGNPGREVHIPSSVYLKALKKTDPKVAVVLLLHAVFPASALSCGDVTGDQTKGLHQLDHNKVEAIREWLAEVFPHHHLGVKGRDWANCVGVLQNILKGLHNTERKVEVHSTVTGMNETGRQTVGDLS